MGWDNINTSRVGGVLYGTPNERDLAQGRFHPSARTSSKGRSLYGPEPDYDRYLEGKAWTTLLPS